MGEWVILEVYRLSVPHAGGGRSRGMACVGSGAGLVRRGDG